MTRPTALAILKEYTKSETLLKHAYAVEAAMRAYAQKYNQNPDLWGAVGLLHDFDYEKYPQQHPMKGADILKDLGVSDEIRLAILGHADCSGVPRTTLLAKTLYAVDELCGFITAVTLVRPNRALSEVQIKSVKKKMKDKNFAAKVNREEILKGTEELSLNFDQHLSFVIKAMSCVAQDLGLNP